MGCSLSALFQSPSSTDRWHQKLADCQENSREKRRPPPERTQFALAVIALTFHLLLLTHTHIHTVLMAGEKKKSDLHAAHLALIWPAASWSMGAWPLTGNEWPQGRAAQSCGLQASRDGRQPGVSTLLAHNGPGWCHDKAMLCSHLASRNFLHASTLTPCSGR